MEVPNSQGTSNHKPGRQNYESIRVCNIAAYRHMSLLSSWYYHLSAPDTIYVSSLIYSLQFYLHPPIITTWKALGSISQINCQCGEGVISRVCVKLSAWWECKVRFGSPKSRGKQQKLNFLKSSWFDCLDHYIFRIRTNCPYIFHWKTWRLFFLHQVSTHRTGVLNTLYWAHA